MIGLLSFQFADLDQERVRRNFYDAIRELQQRAAVTVVRKDVELVDGVITPVAHALGRTVVCLLSPVRNALATGRIDEIQDGKYDRTKYVVLKATGYGSTVLVDVCAL